MPSSPSPSPSPWLLRLPPGALTLLLGGPAVGKTALCFTIARAILGEAQPDLWPSTPGGPLVLLPDHDAWSDPLATRLLSEDLFPDQPPPADGPRLHVLTRTPEGKAPPQMPIGAAAFSSAMAAAHGPNKIDFKLIP